MTGLTEMRMRTTGLLYHDPRALRRRRGVVLNMDVEVVELLVWLIAGFVVVSVLARLAVRLFVRMLVLAVLGSGAATWFVWSLLTGS